MPQMAPMLWLILFIYFIVLFIFYIVSFYFMVIPIPSSVGETTKVSSEKFNWMW